MQDNFYINLDFTYLDSRDLNMYYCGHRKNIPDHSYGPAMRDHHLMVYVRDGCGIYEINGRTYHLKAKSIFVVFPNCKVYYKADSRAPWENIWLGLYGNILNRYMSYMDLNPENPVYSVYEPERLEPLLLKLVHQAGLNTAPSQGQCIGLLYQIFSEMLSDCQESSKGSKRLSLREKYIEKAINYIQFNYNRDISCSDIANHLNLDRSYFSKLFKENLKMAPTEYLIQYRMEKASRLLLQTDLSVEGIAYSVGIHDPFYFSRLFKKFYSVSPLEFRKENG